MPIITIDGNIGSGKSSILNYLHRYNKLSIDLEPVENWQPYLDKMYLNDNSTKDVFNFQVRVWLDRCWIQEKVDKSLILMERSPYFIKNTFIKLSHSLGLLTDNELTILNELYKKTDNIWSCNGYIYLRSNPENCLSRINKRNRKSEDKINIEYLNQLHDLHEKSHNDALSNNMNIIVIDIENKTIPEIANEIFNSLLLKKELLK